MKILIDMNLSPTWVQFLVAQGIEAVHWFTIGKDAGISHSALLCGLSGLDRTG